MKGIKTGINAIKEVNETASKFASSIVIRTDGKHIDAKSLLGLTYTLIDSKTYQLEIHGPDEEEAKQAMVEVFKKHELPVELL